MNKTNLISNFILHTLKTSITSLSEIYSLKIIWWVSTSISYIIVNYPFIFLFTLLGKRALLL